MKLENVRKWNFPQPPEGSRSVYTLTSGQWDWICTSNLQNWKIYILFYVTRFVVICYISSRRWRQKLSNSLTRVKAGEIHDGLRCWHDWNLKFCLIRAGLCMCMLSHFSHVWLCVTLWTVACQTPLSKYWSGLPCPHPGDPPDTGIKPMSLMSPTLTGGFFTTSTTNVWVVVVQSLSNVWLFVTPWTATCQASLSFTISWNLFKPISTESVMPSNHLILCLPLLLLPSIFPSIRVFSNELVLCIRWPKYWNFTFSISPSNQYSGLTSFRIDWFDILAVQGTLKSLLQHHSLKAINSSALSLLYGPNLTSVHNYWKNIALPIWIFVSKLMSLIFNTLKITSLQKTPVPTFIISGLETSNPSKQLYCIVISFARSVISRH